MTKEKTIPNINTALKSKLLTKANIYLQQLQGEKPVRIALIKRRVSEGNYQANSTALARCLFES